MYSSVHCVRRRRLRDNSPTKQILPIYHNKTYHDLWTWSHYFNLNCWWAQMRATRCPNTRNWGQYIPPKQCRPETRRYVILRWRLNNRSPPLIRFHVICQNTTILNYDCWPSNRYLAHTYVWVSKFRRACEELRLYQEVNIHVCDNRCLSFVSQVVNKILRIWTLFLSTPPVWQFLSWNPDYSFSSKQTLAYKTREFERKDSKEEREEHSIAWSSKLCK